jgi:protease I
MRRSESTKAFVRDMDNQEKPIAAICHAGWMLASCCNIKGKKMTSFFSIKDDLVNAGADWVDEPVVVDGPYITSRTPADLIPFVQAIIKAVD